MLGQTFYNESLRKTVIAFGSLFNDIYISRKDSTGADFYLEVKSVTFVENGVAQFPDAITDRGTKHALALKKLVEEGKGAGILFVCQRADAISFRPMWERDPKLANAVLKANNAGVKIWCITLNVSETDMTFNKEIPVNLELQNI